MCHIHAGPGHLVDTEMTSPILKLQSSGGQNSDRTQRLVMRGRARDLGAQRGSYPLDGAWGRHLGLCTTVRWGRGQTRAEEQEVWEGKRLPLSCSTAGATVLGLGVGEGVGVGGQGAQAGHWQTRGTVTVPS